MQTSAVARPVERTPGCVPVFAIPVIVRSGTFGESVHRLDGDVARSSERAGVERLNVKAMVPRKRFATERGIEDHGSEPGTLVLQSVAKEGA